MDETEFLATLDAHDELVRRCARGDLPFRDFEAAYDSLYPRYPLDGHEGGAQPLLSKHERRVGLHRDIWEQVLTKVLASELQAWAGRPEAAGLISEDEAVRRLRALVERHLG